MCFPGAIAFYLMGWHSFLLGGILFSESKALKVLESPKLALNFLMSMYLLYINIYIHNYGINDVSKRVDIA